MHPTPRHDASHESCLGARVMPGVSWLTMMSITQTKWLEEQCRVENGIFFANDEGVLLSGNPKGGYVASSRASLASFLENDVDGWTNIDENPACRAEQDGILVVGGSTSWEGEGFIATVEISGGALIWLLHLTESEAFVEVNFDGENISAVSSEYPDLYRWQIPLNNPESLRVVSQRAS